MPKYYLYSWVFIWVIIFLSNIILTFIFPTTDQLNDAQSFIISAETSRYGIINPRAVFDYSNIYSLLLNPLLYLLRFDVLAVSTLNFALFFGTVCNISAFCKFRGFSVPSSKIQFYLILISGPIYFYAIALREVLIYYLITLFLVVGSKILTNFSFSRLFGCSFISLLMFKTHPGLIVFPFVLICFCFLRYLAHKPVSVISILIMCVVASQSGAYSYFEEMVLSRISLTSLLQVQQARYYLNETSGASIGYPSWMQITSVNGLLTGFVLHAFNFIFGPVFYIFKDLKYAFLFLAAAPYYFLYFNFVKKCGIVLRSRVLFFLALSALAVIVIYSLGTVNFGTGFRHRVKLGVVLITILMPYLPDPQLRWSRG